MIFTLRLLSRLKTLQLSTSCQFHKLSSVLYCDSKHENSPADKGEDTLKPKKNEEAVNKLNLLLKLMTEEEYKPPASVIGAQLARPPIKPKKEKVSTEEPVITAAKKVAETLGGDVKQTESELLNKLLSPSQANEKENAETSKPSINLRDLISGMKIDRSERVREGSEEGRAQQVRRILADRKAATRSEIELPVRETVRQQQGPRMYAEKVDIFGGESLGIFKASESQTKPVADVPELTTWNRLYARELRLAITHPPKNIYEEMIQWTEQGKLWHFPIDNEQGIEEEQKVYFTEHVFLDHHLDPWCPKKGPVRHFMELVCVGLSKNPYLTVQMKLEHINWFRNYFDQKKQVLEETGAVSKPSLKKTTADEKNVSV